ncbi:MAG TPA: OmpA family protein [Candidatus Acidoferrum sp.]|nr:OmpA family protein [Candidatus Acidoferrum sp.]
MNCASRLIATLGFTLAMASALYADDSVIPKAKAPSYEVAAASDTSADSSVFVPPLSLSTWTSSEPRPAAAGHPRPSDDSESVTPKFEWFLGYSFWRAMPTSQSNRIGYLHGGSTSIAYNFNRYLGLVADFGGYDNSKVTLFGPTSSRTFNSDGTAYTYLFGPRFSYRRYERVTPFFQALIGGAYATSVNIAGCTGDASCTPLASENALAAALGVGFDVKLTHHIALRLIEGDFLLTNFRDPFAANVQKWQKNVRLSSGLVFRFGGNPPPPQRVAMSASCSADREMVYADSGDVIALHVTAATSEKYPVNYSWSASDGDVDGTGADVRWSSAGHRTGPYSVKVRVDNGRNGSAECFANLRVEQRPNRPPVIACSADRSTVTQGEPVTIIANASDPDNDPLAYSWSASSGKIDSTESSAKFRTGDLSPGPYTVSGHVDDGRSGTADCSVTVQVEAVRVPAEVVELEGRLALHSIYFQTARPRVDNPTGGLVDSQEKVLLTLSSDFNRYLTFKPQAHLILQGHADHRGTPSYNKELTERRVQRTSNFLTAHGVPSANIETRALGEEDNLTPDQVKKLIDDNPELSTDERQKIEGNLHVIVWANNRRVDVSLNTTGQQSVRQYPFNAKDSLTLLSPSGGEGAKHVRAPRKKTASPLPVKGKASE